MGKFRRNKRSRSNLKGDSNIEMSSKQVTILVVSLLIVIAVSIVAMFLRNKNLKDAYAKEEELRRKEINEILFLAEGSLTGENVSDEEIKRNRVVDIAIVGNIMCEADIINDGYNKQTDSYDFSHIFNDIKKHTQQADITIGNLETNFVNDTISGKTRYNAPKEFGQALKDIGFNVLSTSNNHAYAYGKEGVFDTLDYLDELGIDHVGTKRNGEENILIKEIDGVRLAFLAYTYGLSNMNGVASDYVDYVNITNKDIILKDIQSLEDKEVDYICVNMHWGDGNTDKIKEDQTELTNYLFECGVDLIIGSHPTYIQHIEVRKNFQDDDVFVAFSTGSFISTTGYRANNVQMILNIRIIKDKQDNTYLSKVTYVPMHILDNGKSSENRYRLVDVKEAMKQYEDGTSDFVTEALYKKFNKVLIDIEKAIGKEQ